MNNKSSKAMKLTPQQAIEQGYTHFVEHEGESAMSLQGLLDGKYYFATTRKMFLCGKPYPFHISAGVIQDALNDYLVGQDDVYDENEVLYDELAKADFEAIEKLVNVGFTDRWMDATDIELDLSGYFKEADNG